MSGKNCFEILEKIFNPKKQENIENIKGYTMKYGYIVENEKISSQGMGKLVNNLKIKKALVNLKGKEYQEPEKIEE